VKRRISIFCRSIGQLHLRHLRERGQIDPSVYTTTSNAGSLLRKSAVALGRPGSEQEQSLMKSVIVKFGGSWGGLKSDLLWRLGFPVMIRKVAQN